jgi:CRISPR/Cas system-associated exonuclease Cas4 (RecB family)
LLFEESNLIRQALNDYMVREELDRDQRSARTFHASGLMECARQQIYDRLGYPKDATEARAEWVRSRDVGDLIHTYYAEKFGKAGILTRNEWSLPPNEYEIGGRLDDDVILQGEQYIVDIKTVDQKKFNQVPKGEKFPANYLQLQVYLYFLGLPKGILLYVNRSDNATKEFTIYRDEEAIEQALNRALQLKGYLHGRVIPRPERSWKCPYCPFLIMCGMDGDDEIHLGEKQP